MTYLYAQFHGLNVNVFPEKVSNQEVKYLGEKETHVDIARKMILFEQAIETSYVVRDPTANTLHIFMLPEFYWRPESGYYSDLFGGKDVTEYISDEAKYVVKDAKFNDWVFVLGTCISGSPDGTPQDIRGVTRNKYLIRNTAIVIGGGPSGSVHRMTKKNMSHIDFANYLDANGNHNGGMRNSFKMSNDPKDAFYSTSLDGGKAAVTHRGSISLSNKIFGGRAIDKNVREGLFFEEKGVQFTLEICLDHGEGRAKNTMADYSALPVASRPYYSQIHLIPSAGMEIIKNNIPLSLKTQSSCVAFNNDGRYCYAGLLPSDKRWPIEKKTNKGESYYPPIYAAIINSDGKGYINQTEVGLYKAKVIDISAHKSILGNFIKDAQCLSQRLESVIGDANGDIDMKNFAMKKICRCIALSLTRVEIKRWLWKFFILSLINRKSGYMSSRRVTATLQRIRAELNSNGEFRQALSKCGLARVKRSNGNLTDEDLRDDIKALSKEFGQVIHGPLTENRWWTIAIDGLALEDMNNKSSSRLARTSSINDNGIGEERRIARKQMIEKINEVTADRHNNQVPIISDDPIFKEQSKVKGYYVVTLKRINIPVLSSRQ